MIRRLVLLACLALSSSFATTVMPPSAEQQLAQDIFKQLIEIRSGFTRGATTPIAEAMATRLREAGFSDSEMFIGGATEKKKNLVVRYRGTGSESRCYCLHTRT